MNLPLILNPNNKKSLLGSIFDSDDPTDPASNGSKPNQIFTGLTPIDRFDKISKGHTLSQRSHSTNITIKAKISFYHGDN